MYIAVSNMVASASFTCIILIADGWLKLAAIVPLALFTHTINSVGNDLEK